MLPVAIAGYRQSLFPAVCSDILMDEAILSDASMLFMRTRHRASQFSTRATL
jgi:hypothetical protein